MVGSNFLIENLNFKNEYVCYLFFSETSEDKQLSQEDLLRCPTRKFPPEQLFSHSFPDNYFITLVPIHSENNCPWGVVAIIDKVEHCVQVSYGIFNNYLDLMSLFIERDALIESIKQREQKATDLAKQLEVVASTSNDGIWDWDLGNNEINWNNRLLEMLGFKQTQEKHAYRHMNLFDRIHPDDDQEIRNQVTAHIKKNTPFKATFRLLSNHNEYLWVEASGKALRTPQGRATRFIGSMTDITQQRLHQQRIRHMAYHDTLTGLPNRAMLDEFLKDHIRHRGLNPLSVMLMDLDRFKLINDSYGHDVGDALLRHVAKTLQPLLRSSDFFARFGGDEFVFVSPLAEESQAIELAQRLLDGVETPFKYKGIDLSSQGSIGIAFYPTDGTSADDLIKKADIAMYRAKRIEKSSATLYHSAMNSDIQQQASLEQQLKLALAQAQFDVHFQPQINPLGGRLLGIEALARWNNPVLGQVSPERFIAAAESMGLISELGKQVGIKAMQTLARWNRDYPQMTLQLSINVSPGQLMRPNFSDEFLSWIDTTQCPANKITVEVTESTTLNDLEHSRTMLLRLAEQGVVISLDDFGTGYSSLALLKQLPLSWIKIDRSFVRDLETDKSNQDIIKSIVMLCHSFGFQTVAEGVETEEQLQIISDIGCDWVQGFIYSPALSANEFEQKYLKTTQAQDKQKPDNYPAH